MEGDEYAFTVADGSDDRELSDLRVFTPVSENGLFDVH